MPLADQRQRVGLHVQQHIGPHQLHSAVCRGLRQRSGRAPALCSPPGWCYQFNSCLSSFYLGFHHITCRFWVLQCHFLVGLQPAAHGAPMGPSGRGVFDPLQPLLHARAHFFVQPRGLQRGAGLLVTTQRVTVRRAMQRAVLRPVGSGCWVDSGRAVVGHAVVN